MGGVGHTGTHIIIVLGNGLVLLCEIKSNSFVTS
jgi:hypothetical protein